MDERKVIIDLPPPPVVELSSDDLVEAGLTQPLQPRHILAAHGLTQAGPYPSIAPSAIDVEPASWRPPPRKNTLPIVLGVMGVCGTLAAIAGVVGFHRYREKQREDAAYAAQIADEDRRSLQKQSAASMDPPPVVDPVPTVAPISTVDPIPTVKLDPPKPVAKPVVTAAPKPPPPAVKNDSKQTGTLRTYSSAAGKAVFVDGKQAGVAPAPITVACGMHQIRVGEGKTRSVNVPCFGAITVGTPDGN